MQCNVDYMDILLSTTAANIFKHNWKQEKERRKDKTHLMILFTDINGAVVPGNYQQLQVQKQRNKKIDLCHPVKIA